ncbi:MAG: hypothetical protein ACI81T_003753, partial [Bacteroidia bacterium]
GWLVKRTSWRCVFSTPASLRSGEITKSYFTLRTFSIQPRTSAGTKSTLPSSQTIQINFFSTIPKKSPI